jgi:hypothetical protein
MSIEKEVQAKDIENIFNKVIEENFPNLEKEMVIQIQKTFWTPNRQERQNSSKLIVVETLGIQNKKGIMQTRREVPNQL